MKKILFYNSNGGGVNFYRTSQPAIKLQEMCPEEYHVTIKQDVEGLSMKTLSEYDIIHFHNTLADFHQMPSLFGYLQAKGVKMILDLDDYWVLPANHQKSATYQKFRISEGIADNIRMADAVTVSTEYLADKVRRLNKNVVVIPNAVDLSEKQFSYDPVGSSKQRIGWLGGSTHLEDLKLLDGLSAKIFANPNYRDKVQMRLYGFDPRHTVTSAKWKPEFLGFLKEHGLAHPQVLKDIVTSNYDLRKSRSIPANVAAQWDKAIFDEVKEQVPAAQTIWAQYERIITDQYRIINDSHYCNWLKQYDTQDKVDDEKYSYVRIPTTGLSNYANGYRTMDIALAPLKSHKKAEHRDNRYVFAKSPLKLIEAGAHKVPVVASMVPPYMAKGLKDGLNISYIKPERQQRDWYKKVGKLLSDKSMIQDMGESLHEWVKKSYTLDKVTKLRSEFYLDLCK